MEIINNTSIAEAQKQDAIDSMIQMTDVAEKENAAEIETGRTMQGRISIG